MAALLLVFLLRSFFVFNFDQSKLELLLKATMLGGASLVFCLIFAWLLNVVEARQAVKKIRTLVKFR